MKTRDMIKAKLIEIKADGLCTPDAECGCDIDDLFPCGKCSESECFPAKKIPTPEKDLYHGCSEFIYVPLESKESGVES